MSSPLIVPKFVFPGGVYGVAGAACAGFKVNTYAAGTATPQATYTDSTLSAPNANPVVMDANGQANIWLGNASYKFVGTDSVGTVLWTVDNVTQASLGSLQSEWVSFNAVPVFISTTSFSLTGITDLTVAPYFVAIGTRVRTVNTGGTIYSTVITVSGNTVTVKNDSGVIDAGISSASYGIIAGSNSSLARRSLYVAAGSAATTLANGVLTTLTGAASSVLDYLGEGSNASFVPTITGTYRVIGYVLFNELAGTTGIQNVLQTVSVLRAGSSMGNTSINWPVAASTASTQTIPFDVTFLCSNGFTVAIGVTAQFTGTAPTASVGSFNVERLL